MHRKHQQCQFYQHHYLSKPIIRADFAKVALVVTSLQEQLLNFKIKATEYSHITQKQVSKGEALQRKAVDRLPLIFLQTILKFWYEKECLGIKTKN